MIPSPNSSVKPPKACADMAGSLGIRCPKKITQSWCGKYTSTMVS